MNSLAMTWVRGSIVALALGTLVGAQGLGEPLSPEQLAVNYLSKEVPSWSSENGCHSCHNDGDGARALLFAASHGMDVPTSALAPSTKWLRAPERWSAKQHSSEGGDKHLARIQFAAALNASPEVDESILRAAADQLAADQQADGSWAVANETPAGSPATYGGPMATALSLAVLERANRRHFSERIEKARAWLETQNSAALPLQAAIAFSHDPSEQRFVTAVGKIVASQNSDGGWGPYPGSPSECFDTALAVLAMSRSANSATATERGRGYLIDQQLDLGGWPETTRPSGGDSYGQHISTTAWATMALIATR